MEQDTRVSGQLTCTHGGGGTGQTRRWRRGWPRAAVFTSSPSHHICRAFRRNSTCRPGPPGDMKVYLPTWEHRINLDHLLVGFITCKGLYSTALHLQSDCRAHECGRQASHFPWKGCSVRTSLLRTLSSVAGTGSGICVHLGVHCMFETCSVC